MMSQRLSTVVCLLLSICGCGESEPTIAETHDTQIVESWFPGRSTGNAVEFFEGGGQYESMTADSDIDREHLLPLLRTLQDDLGLQPVVLLDEPDIAFAVVIDVSDRTIDRGPVVDAIVAADEQFPGLILDKWGNDWLSIDVLDTGETAMMAEGGQLEQLQIHLAEERAAVRSGS